MKTPGLDETKIGVESDVTEELLEHRNGRILNEQTPKTPPLWNSKRMLISIMMFLCLAGIALIRNNINIAVVEMTSNKTITVGNISYAKPPEFDWDTTTIGMVISTLSYGGLLSFLSGFLVNSLGGSLSMALFLAVSGIMTYLHPYVLNVHFYLFILWRFVTGIFESFTVANSTEIFARWYPRKERSRLIAYSFNGMHIGIAIAYPLCGYIAHSYGWQMVFYVTGVITITLSLLCVVLVRNKPTQDKRITKEELTYILAGTDQAPKAKVRNPFKKILLSGPVWALCLTKFTYMWIYTVITACLPLYVKDMTQKNTKEIGYISFVPNIFYILMFPVVGSLMDYCKNHSKTTETRMHKTIASIVLISSSVLLLSAAILSNFVASLIIFSVIQILMSFMSIVTQTVTVTIAPNNSSAVSGLSNSFKELGNVTSRIITGYMIMNHSLHEWNNCFLLAAGILFLNAVVFLIYGSSEVQPWSISPDDHEKSDDFIEK